MKKLIKIVSVLLVVVTLTATTYISIYAGKDPILPPLPPCPICNPEGRNVDPPGSYFEEK
ncbi:MAG: hypothetical protein FWC95_04525 [Defluviitaleaceae bacterium]|nr:hypothetical protein [Defluviitaleaceae bacterium]